MKIPTTLTTQIKRHFYDKEVSVYNTISYKTKTGFAKNELGSLIETIDANVQFANLARIQEDFGIDVAIDLAMTCPTESLVALGNVLEYDSSYYRVVKAIPFDSHKLIVAEKWSLDSRDLISA